MAKRQEYDAETKASVMAELLKGQAISHVAEKYDIPEGTVKGWKSKAKEAGSADVPTEKRERIGELLIDYLEASIHSLRVQAQHFGDREWLMKQDAADLAVLHGVQTDKAVRLMEALGGAGDRNTP